MVHTAIPYASFASASNYSNSQGGLWDIADGNNPPGSFSDEVGYKLFNSGFTGQVYGDVDVSSVGGPNSFLNFVWSFEACGASDDGVITTSVGDSSFSDNILACFYYPAFAQVKHDGMVQVNNEGYIRIVLSSPYLGEGVDNINVYTAGFKLQLTLVSPGSSSAIIGTSNAIGELATTAIAASNSQHSSQSSSTTTVESNNTSTLLSMSSHLSSITTSGTRPQTGSGTALSPSLSTNSVITSLPRLDKPDHSQLLPIICGAVAGLALLSLITFFIWRYRYIWRQWKIWKRRKSLVHLKPFFVNPGQGNANIAPGAGEERNGNVIAGRNRRWGRNGLDVMDGYGLEIVEKIRRGMPVAYPLPDSLEVERGEKARGFPFTDDSQSQDNDPLNGGYRVSQMGTSRSSTPIAAVSNAVIETFNEALELFPPTYPPRRSTVHNRYYILNRSISNSRADLRDRSQPIETIPPQSSPPSIAPPPSLMRRIDLLSGLLHQILASGVPTSRADTTHTNPPPAYDGEETN